MDAQTPRLISSKHVFSTSDLTWEKTKDGRWALYARGIRQPLLHVVPDAKYPGIMWRIEKPDGELSDMVNLTRAKDAGQLHGLAIIRKSQADWRTTGAA